MKDSRKTKAQLIAEVETLRAQIEKLADMKSGHSRARMVSGENEEHRLQLIENADDIIYETDAKGYFTYVNPVAVQVMGYSKEELMGKHFLDLIREDYRPKANEFYSRQRQGRVLTTYFEFPAVTKDKNEVWFGQNVKLVAENGQIKRFQAICRVITEQKVAVEGLRLLVEGAMSQVGDKFFRSLVRHLAAALRVRFAFITEVVEGEEYQVQLLSFWTGDGYGENFAYDVRGTPCEHVLGKKLVRFPSSVKDHFRQDQWIQENEIESYLAIPLFSVSDKPIGHLGVMNILPMKESATAESILNIFAARASSEMERKRNERDLRFTRFSVTKARDTVVWIGSDGHFIDVNEAASETFGYSREELLTMSIHDIDPEFPCEVWPAHWAELKRQRSLLFESTHRSKDGKTIPVEIMANYFEFEGREYNCAVARDITVRKRSERKIRESEELLRALSKRLVQVQESERRHIARELHDEIGQTLTGLRFALESAPNPEERCPSGKLEEAKKMIDQLMGEVRALSLSLRPPMLDDRGLLPALHWHLKRYTKSTGLKVDFNHKGLDRRFPEEIETVVYRIVQESLTNAARHAGVERLSVRVWPDDSTFNVEIKDEGCGFDPDTSQFNISHLGISGMRERAIGLGGHLTIDSAPGMGTCLHAVIPLKATHEPGTNGEFM